jgi:dipeptidyl aminopeptidase/acylaminoacyl peptidase
MREALRQAERPGEYLELPGEDHWLSTESSRIQVLTRLEEFLARYLQSSKP